MTYTISSTTSGISATTITSVYDSESSLEGGATLADGTTVTLNWGSNGTDNDVFQTVTTSDNTVLVNHVAIGADTSGSQWYSKAVALPNGGYTIVWKSDGGSNTDSFIYAATYDSQGMQQGDQIRIDTGDTATEDLGGITVGTDGTISVLWDDGNGTNYETLLSPNAAPVAVNDKGSVHEGSSVAVAVTANDTDADNDTLTVSHYSVTTGNGTVSLDNDGKLVVTYTGADLAPHEKATIKVHYTVTDGIDTDTATLKVKVVGVAEPGDDIFGTLNDNKLNGTNVAEHIYGRDGNDVIKGLHGDDFLFGNRGDDKLIGGAGHDVLDGGMSRHNQLTGGAGSDTFVFAKGGAVVTDFDVKGADHDVIDISSFHVGSFKDLKPFMEQDGKDVVITLSGHELTLQHVDLDMLSKEHFTL